MGVRGLMRLALIAPVLLAVPVVLGLRDREWWRQVALIIGGGYLLPVFGTLAGWRLVALARRGGSHAVFCGRVAVGGLLLGSYMVISIVLREPVAALPARLHDFFLDFRMVLVLLLVGVLYALLPHVRHVRAAGDEERK